MNTKTSTKAKMKPFSTWSFRILLLSILLLLPLLFYKHIISQIILSRSYNRASSNSRFNRNPWVYPTTSTPILPRTSHRNRAFMSSIWSDCRDGLGHRLSMINFELLIAHELNVGYIHRRGTYGSLSPVDDPYAVERLFGWDMPETRDEMLERSCKKILYDTTGCRWGMEKKRGGPVCRELKTKQQGGLFKHLVDIPTEMVDCFVEGKSRPMCGKELSKFAERFGMNDTLFQMVPGKCSPDYRVPWFENTREWLLHKYWGFHGGLGERAGVVGMLKGTKRTRNLGFDEKRVQVAVHVRRGDFMNFTDRVMIEDKRYGEIVMSVKRMIDKRFGKNVGMDMHIYSEGVPKSGWYRNNHDVNEMLPVYVTEKGEKKVNGKKHWEEVMGRLLRRRRFSKEDLNVFTHIASDTVTAIHEMISADFFVGSLSGMSLQLVNVYSRGFVILPTKGKTLPKSDGRVVRYHATGKSDDFVRTKDIENIVNIFASRYQL